ncbi:MAG: histidine phosphatase family protein, partial [Acidimicrobiales bacterium]
MDLIIVRHARPQREERADHEGPADPSLATLGHQQAQAVADHLAGEQIDHIVASTMARAHETAIPLANRLGLKIELRDDLREVDQNSNRYVPIEEMSKDDPWVKEFRRDPLVIFDGDYEGFRNRVVAGFDAVIGDNGGKRVAVFCHGMVTSVYLQVLWSLEGPYQIQSDYTGITRVRAASSSGN